MAPIYNYKCNYCSSEWEEVLPEEQKLAPTKVMQPEECDIFIAPHSGLAKCDVELVGISTNSSQSDSLQVTPTNSSQSDTPSSKKNISSISTCSSDQYKPIQILFEVFLQQMHDPYYRSIL